MNEVTKEWEQYQKGLEYHSKIRLLPTADKNERFYAGRQWEGLNTSKLSLIVLNVIKRIIDFKIAVILSDNITMQFSAEGVADSTKNEQQIAWRKMASVLSTYAKTTWENLKVDAMSEDGILDAALSGDLISYWFLNEKAVVGTDTMGNPIKGGLDGEKIDSCNCMFGDPNDDRINDAYGPVQPYIILAFRRQVKDVKREAKENGIPQEEIDLITADDETTNQMGDRAKTELETNGDDGKCIVLLKLWPDEGQIPEANYGKRVTIWAKKSTRQANVRKEWDTELHRYPVAMMNWHKRKNSIHGEADVTSMIPNQIEINRTASMIARWVRLHGFPKIIYDSSRIPAWSNEFAFAQPVNGEVGGAAQYIQATNISAAVMEFMTWFIQITKEMAGANESALGESSPTNTSAIIVNSKSATIPLNPIKHRFYQYIEDVGLIWEDFWLTKFAKYGEIMLPINNEIGSIPFNTKLLEGARLKLKIDVGPSNQWNEAAAAQTLDNLLQRRLIDFVEYLKRLPNGLIPDRQGLIEAREGAEAQQRAADKALLYELMSQYEQQLPPEAHKRLSELRQNKPDQYEAAVKQMIRENPRPYAGNVEGGGMGEVQSM